MSNDDEDRRYGRVQEASAALRRLMLEWKVPLGRVPGKRFSNHEAPNALRRHAALAQGYGTESPVLSHDDGWRNAVVRYTWNRVRTICSHGPSGGSREGVFKAISWLKCAGSVRRAVEYIVRSETTNRLSQDVPVTAWHEIRPGLALPLRSVESIEQALEIWNLLPDVENLSLVARSASQFDIQAMAPKDRFQYRQALHCTFSAVVTSPDDRKRFVEAAREGLRDIFVLNGHRVIWAIHEDKRRIHVHMIVQVRQSESLIRDGIRPKRIQFGWRTADMIRHEFVRRMRENGLNLTATSRIDRDRTREAIVNNDEESRRSRTKGLHTGLAKLIRNLEIFAPQWTAREMPGYERRRAMHVAARMEYFPTARAAWKRATATARSWDDLETVLGEEGWRLVISPKPRRRMTLESGAIRYPLRALDRSMGLEKLETSLGEKFEQWRSRKSSGDKTGEGELPPRSIWSVFQRSAKTKSAPIDAIVEKPAADLRWIDVASQVQARATARQMFENIFINADMAIQSYGNLRAELAAHGRWHLTSGDKVRTRSLETFADWMMIHRPEFFGEIDPANERHLSVANLRKLLVLADFGSGDGAVGQQHDQDYVRCGIQQARNLRRAVEEKRRYERWVREVNRLVLGLKKIADSIDRIDPGDPATTRMSKAIVDIARVTARRAIGVAEAIEAGDSNAPSEETRPHRNSITPSYTSLLGLATVRAQSTVPDRRSQSGNAVPER